MTPFVSILIPCYNAERWVGAAIESALAQTWPEKEVIVVDDGSTDGSLAVIQSFGARIRWETGPNRGGGPARNRLLALAGGDWIQYLDADDYLLSDKVAHQVAYLMAHPETDIVIGPNTLEYWWEDEVRREVHPIHDPHDPLTLLARGRMPQTGAMLGRKKVLLEVGGWKQDQPCGQEFELYLRLLMAGKIFGYCPEGGSIWRHWSDQTVSNRNQPEMRRRRLEIAQRLESYLRDQNVLTPKRRWAINQTRFDLARAAWGQNHDEALAIMEIIHRSYPTFLPAGESAPTRYRWVYRALGFSAAERVAGWFRHAAPPPKKFRDFTTVPQPHCQNTGHSPSPGAE